MMFGLFDKLLVRARRRRLRARPASRRGTIIVLALGVLAVMSIAAVSYVAIVRTERQSAEGAQRDINVQQQVNTVVAHIKNLLAADLFGNKIVTRDVPTTRWPRAFEDGEYTDHPSVYGPWAVDPNGTNNPAAPQITDTAAVLYEPSDSTTGKPAIAPRDDAWLGGTEPVWDLNTPGNSYWMQLSNLLSAYRFQPGNRAGTVPDRWVRDSGRFVDLAQMFLHPTASGAANPAADLSDGGSYPARVGTAFYTIPNQAGVFPPNPGDVPTKVPGWQMNRVEDANNPLTQAPPHQYRRFTDVDGDLRPDARWQQLDALGNTFGLTWVVAARIIDASSLVNYNTATTFPYKDLYNNESPPGNRSWVTTVGTGATPADVDLLRLIGYGAPNAAASVLSGTFGTGLVGTQIWPADIYTNRLLDNQDPAYRRMLARAQGFGPTIRKLGEEPLATTDPNYEPPYDPLVRASLHPEQAYPSGGETSTGPWTATDYPTIAQRAAWYTYYGSDPEHAATPLATALPPRDVIDLFAFWGTNNANVTSRLEQLADGTDASGYLPGSSTPNGYGPLRSREGTTGQPGLLSSSPRRFGNPDESAGNAGWPTVTQLVNDNRHLVTPLSGVGNIGPVPVLNKLKPGERAAQPSYFDGQASLPRINLAALEDAARKVANGGGVVSTDAQRLFDTFTWALAPLTTDKPLSRELGIKDLYSGTPSGVINGSVDKQYRYHYGGTIGQFNIAPNGKDGPAKMLNDKLFTSGGPLELKASYAVLKAACLTANLIDALDLSTAVTTTPNNPQADVHSDESPTVLRIFNTSTVQLPGAAQYPGYRLNNVRELGTRMAQGSIPTLTGVGGDPAQDASPLRPEFFGFTKNGAGNLTVVGLDRQPFLVQASYFAFYEDRSAVGGGEPAPSVDPTSPDDQLGSIMAFELRNPWPQPVLLTNYKVMVRHGTRTLSFDLSNSDTNVPLIPAGGVVVAWYALGPAQSPGTPPPEFVNYWFNAATPSNSIVGQFESMLAAAPGYTSPDVPTLIRLKDPSIAGVTGLGALVPSEDGGTVQDSDLTPVFVHWLLGASAPDHETPVLLVRKGGGITGPNFDVLVDRLSPPVQPAVATAAFPDVLTAPYTMPPFPTVSDGGTPATNVNPVGRLRLAVASTMHRPTDNVAGASGFSPYVIERRSQNKLRVLDRQDSADGTTGTHKLRQLWRTGPVTPLADPPPPIPDPEPTAQDFINSDEGIAAPATETARTWLRPGAKSKGTMKTDGGADLVFNFQLFNPTAAVLSGANIPALPRLRFATDLLLLPTVATLYIHPNRPNDPAADYYPKVEDAADLTLSYDVTDPAKPFIKFAKGNENNPKGTWVTASEQLGSDWELFRDQQQVTLNPTGETNPYLGVLDPTRFTLSQQVSNVGNNVALPQDLTIPFALRVPMAFDALRLRTDLASGRVNINTAPKRVLSSLPFLWPLTGIANAVDDAGSSTTPVLPAPNGTQVYPLLANWLLPYRELNLDTGVAVQWNRVAATGIPGLRSQPAEAPQSGLVTTSELGLLAQWEGYDNTPTDSGKLAAPLVAPNAFGSVVSAGFVLPAADAQPLVGLPLGRFGNDAAQFAAGSRPKDGPEERLALVRAMANIAETRSDVYLAWFELRGYDPDVIQSIQVAPAGASPSLAEAQAAMDSGKFVPTVDTRWLALLDRSSVKSPLDRPKVLVLVELPSARP